MQRFLKLDKDEFVGKEATLRQMNEARTLQLVYFEIDADDADVRGGVFNTFDRWYDDDVVMSENGVDERVGKAANRAYEEAFVNGVEFHGAEPGLVIVDGDTAAVEWAFDFTPKGMIETLDLRRPIYRKTAAYGHFGREDADFPWERTDMAETLAKEAGIK